MCIFALMNFRMIGLLLLTAMILTGFVARDFFGLEVPQWLPSLLGALGIVAMGISAYQEKKFKRFAIMAGGLLLIFIVLIVIQFTTNP